jgi:WD40 repeat protein/serine/threonine protein kinase
MIPCPYGTRLGQFLDRQLGEEESREIDLHVETCPLCTEELERLTASDGKGLPLPPVPLGDSTAPDSAPAANGELPAVPGYLPLRVLGRGGRGIVYLADDARLPRRVALKMILAGSDAGPRDLARFRIEMEAHARLEHPNIIPIYQVGDYQDRPFFAMEYVSGGTLKERLQEGLPPPRDAARLAETLARAMHYAHQRGVLHRDLTPANVLLQSVSAKDTKGHQDQWAEDRDRKAERPTPPPRVPSCPAWITFTPKISDFGLAKFLDAKASQTCLTRSHEIVGTASYMAPEQAAGKVGEVGTLTDVYGLGAVLYQMLTGHAPFEGASIGEILTKVQSDGALPPPPRRWRSAVPADLELICLKCLEKESARRYASAEQLADELGRFREGKPLIHTRPVGRVERLWRWCRRNPALAAACTITVLALIAGTSVSAVFGLSKARTAGKLVLALDESREKARQLEETNRKAADLALALGLHLCEQGDVSLGVLWLAQSLETAPPDAKDLQRAIRTNLAAWGDTLRPLRATLPASSEVLAVAYSPDGKLVVTGTEDGTAQLWDAATGEPSGPPLRCGAPPGSCAADVPRRNRIMAVTFGPDSRTVLVGSWDKSAYLWDVATRQAITLTHPDEVWAVAFSPDGKQVLTGSGEPFLPPTKPCRGEARLWEAATGKLLHVLPHGDRVYTVAFNRDGRVALTGSSDKTARLWDAASGCLLRTLPHEGRVWAAIFSPDDTKVLTGSSDNTARLWDVATGRLIVTLPHTGAVWAVAFSPDGQILLTGDYNHTAQLWKTETGAALRPPLPHDGPVHAGAFSPDGKTVLTGCGDRTARLWDVATGRPLGPPLLNQGEVRAVAFSPDGKTALTGSQDPSAHTGQARLWDLTPKYAAAPLRPPGKVSAVALSSDGKWALAGGEGRAWLCETATGNPVGEPFGPEGEVAAAAFSPDGKTVLLAEDEIACRWDVASRQRFGPGFRCGTTIHALAFSPDGRTVLTGAGGGARLWKVTTGDPVGEPLSHESPVWAATFGPEGKTAMTGCLDGTARLWDLTSGKPLGPALSQDKAGSVPHRKVLLAIALSPDGMTALTGSEGGCARLWNVSTGKPIGPPLLHQDMILAVAFSADGNAALTATAKQVRRWGVPAPVGGDVKRLVLWSQVITGTELDLGGAVRGLDAKTWQERRLRLAELGGPPRS